MKSKHAFSIKSRVITAVAIPAFMVSIVLTAYILLSQTQQIERHLQEKGEQLTRDVAFMSEFALVSGDRAGLLASLRVLIHDSEVVSIKILNQKKALFLTIDNTNIEQLHAYDAMTFTSPVYLTLADVNTFDIADDLNINDSGFANNTTASKKIVGYVSITISQKSLLSERKRLYVIALSLALGTLLISLVVGTLLTHSITTPIHYIVKAVRKIRQGKYKTRIHASANDELSKLADDIDQLAAKLQRSTHKINQQMLDLSEEKQKSDEANQAKSTFLANVSHDFRDPLNAIVTSLEILKDLKPTTYQQQYLHISEISANQLLQLIQNILDFSQADVGKMHISPDYFSIRRIIENIVSIYSVEADKKKLHLAYHYDISENLHDCRLYTDPTRVQQILLNLVGNAIKYTQQGSITIKVSLKEKPNLKACLKIEVIDTGIGIPASKLDSIFNLFEQVSDSSHRSDGGVGMGLAITELVSTALGGTIFVKSTHGKGSTFTFQMDVDYIQSKETGIVLEQTLTLTAKEASSKRILYVEDNPNNRITFQGIMKVIGVDIDTVSNGKDCLDMLKHSHYDIIYLDCFMPDMNGFELAKNIRKFEQAITDTTRKSLLIAVTGMAQNNIRKQCFDAGIDDILLKPVTQLTLYNNLTGLLKAENQMKNITYKK